MSNKTNAVRAILLDVSECDRPEADNPDTIEISAADLQLILERHIKEPAQCLHQIAEPVQAVQPAVPEGWKLVPMEPLDMQQVAGAQAIRFDTTVINKMWTANKVSREMVAAAPAHPAEGVPAQAVQITLNGYQLLAALRLANPSLDFAPMELLSDIVLSDTALVDFDGAQLHEGPIAWVDGVNESAIALEAEHEHALCAATQPAAQGLDALCWGVVANHWKKATFKYDRKGDLASFVVSIDLSKQGLGVPTIASTFDEALTVLAAQAKQGGA